MLCLCVGMHLKTNTLNKIDILYYNIRKMWLSKYVCITIHIYTYTMALDSNCKPIPQAVNHIENYVCGVGFWLSGSR